MNFDLKGYSTKLKFVKSKFEFPTYAKTHIEGAERNSLSFTEIKSIEHGSGRISKWQQFYKGEPVFGSVLTTHHNEDGTSNIPTSLNLTEFSITYCNSLTLRRFDRGVARYYSR